MPVALTSPPEPPAPLSPPRKRWTRAECAALESLGIWDQEKVELVDGELISKMGKNRPHVNFLFPLLFWLADVFGRERINSEMPIDVAPEDMPTNEPQPDLIVLNRPSASFRTAPQPADLLLVVEVSDTSLQFDLTVKAPLYARAGIAEYWVVDIAGRRLIVHRDPHHGSYRSVVAYSESETVAPLAAPANELRVGEVFPA
jgi:Uma2 family endonuclease